MPRIVPLKYTGARLEDYETAKIFYGSRRVPREAIEELNRREKRARKDAERRAVLQNKREAERIAQMEQSLKQFREQKKQARKTAAERKAADKQIKKLGESVLFTRTYSKGDVITQDDMLDIADKMINKKTKLARFIISYDGSVDSDFTNTVDSSRDREYIYWESIFWAIRVQHSEESFSITNLRKSNGNELPEGTTIRLSILSDVDVPAERLRQSFRDGAVHCVIQPLVEHWEKMANNCKTKETTARFNRVVATLTALESKYTNGVPQGEDMEVVARTAKRKVIICNILNQELEVYNKNCNKLFVFTNTRKNHVEAGKLAINCNYDYVTRDELSEIINDHIINDRFFYIDGDIKNGMPSRIRSIKGAWCVPNAEKEIFDAFNANNKIKDCAINAVNEPMLNSFLKASRIINAWVAPLSDSPNDATGHIDMKAAYTQAEHCSMYEGYLGVIHQYRNVEDKDVTFMDAHPGIYQFRVCSLPCALLSKLGIKYNECYILPSPEIKFFIKLGLIVKLIAGAWGKTIDIKWTPEMLEHRRYCLWAGKLGQDSPDESYTFRGDRKWASHLKSTLGDSKVYYSDYRFENNDYSAITVRVPKKSYFTTHHVLSFITSYVRILMMETMLKFDISQLRKVVLDGLYFVGENQEASDIFGVKPVKEHNGFRNGWYFADNTDYGFSQVNNNLLCNSVLTGQGGSGKSYSVLKDSGFVNIMYVVPQHKLGQKMREKHNVKYETIHKMIGLGCRPHCEEKRSPNVIFVDELTMLEAAWVDKLIELYPNALIFIAGDVDNKMWYQCRNGKPGSYSNIWLGNNWNKVEYLNDYRSQCDELKKFKLDIRCAMRNFFTDGGVSDSKKLNDWIISNYKTVPEHEAIKLFNSGDTWIAGTHRTNDRLIKHNIISGSINPITKELSSSVIDGWTTRATFTTHSYQGLTIENGKVFVSINDAFELAMLYTAVSRAVRMNQIILVA